MKSTPSEETLAKWFEGQLSGEDFTQVEAYVQDHPELLAQKQAFARTAEVLRESVPGSVEPPYPDFFNSQIQKKLREDDDSQPRAAESAPTFWQKWSSWFMPAAAAAVVMAFFAGTQVSQSNKGAPQVAAGDALYTPYGEVNAQVVRSVETGSTVIVLDGLEAIPDSVDMVSIGRHEEATGIVHVSTSGAAY